MTSGRAGEVGWHSLVMIKSINPDLVDLKLSLSREPREKIQQAFMIAHHSLDITPLQEPGGKSIKNGLSVSQ